MYAQKKPFFMICETPVHAGSGSDLGIIDLPVQREKHTGYPKIEASGIKGVIREYFDNSENILDSDKEENKSKIGIIFGPKEGDGASSAAGFIDARILFFPVKSVNGIFAYVTCPDVLSRFKRDLTIFNNCFSQDIDNIPINSICNESRITKDNVVNNADNIVLLEEYAFENCRLNNDLTSFTELIGNFVHSNVSYWSEKIKKDVIVVSNDVFKDFVELYSEVIARTRIDPETGTVTHGALWYEEYLPADTIMYSCLMTSNPFIKIDKCPEDINSDTKIMNKLIDEFPTIIQIGGNSTIGKGFIQIEFMNQDIENAEGGDNA